MNDTTAFHASTGGGLLETRAQKLLGLVPWLGVHVAVVVALFFFPVRPIDLAVCFGLYFVRMFGVTGAYHRYFSHRTYKTSRVFQFLLAVLAESSAQKGVIWWASRHRHHHKFSDQPQDLHSPRQAGFWHAHMWWIFEDNGQTDNAKMKDIARFPEIVFIDKFWWIPPVALGFLSFAVLGFSGLFFGFLLSTVLLWHGTYTINSLSHVFGHQDYETGEDSKNNFVLALITLGEGWHNNHHYYMSSTAQGWKWYQIDITYSILKAMSWVGLVWDLREPPQAVLDGKWKPGKSRDLRKPVEASPASVGENASRAA